MTISQKNRTQLMGYAIIMVLIYHYGCWVYNIFGGYNIGFVGVDIFMFLSGWGLVYSYKNSRNVKEFYIKRAKRVLPTFFLMYFLIIAYKILSPHLHESVLSIILELTTLSYWLQTDPNPTDWFLNCIIGFYILFPLFRKNISYFLFTVLTFAVIIFDINVSVRWDLAQGINRIPVFIFGILCAVRNFDSRRNSIFCTIILLLFIPILQNVNMRLALSFMMFVFIYVCSLLEIPRLTVIEWMGRHSLPLYAANQVTFMFMSVTNKGLIVHTMAYIILQILFTIVFIQSNKMTTKYIFVK